MFDSIVSKITNTIRGAVHTVNVATRKTPWLMPVAILALLLVW